MKDYKCRVVMKGCKCYNKGFKCNQNFQGSGKIS